VSKQLDPVTGPIPRDKFKALVDAPHGDAREEIRKRDPFWGLPEGAKIAFDVEVRAEVIGYAVVRATSLEEAKKAAKELTRGEIEFDSCEFDSFDVESVAPCPPPRRRREPLK
jgi:hypothetical protein